MSNVVDWGALNWTAIVAATAFVLAQVIGLMVASSGRRRARKNLARALRAEIIACFGDVEEKSSTVEEYEAFLATMSDKDAAAITRYPATKIYEANISQISLFPRDLVDEIVSLYALADSINLTSEGMKEDIFKAVPDPTKKIARGVLAKKLVTLLKLKSAIIPKLGRFE